MAISFCFNKMPRKHERTSYLNEVMLEWSSGKREARISDLSLGGCFVDTIVTIRPGDDVVVRVSSKDGESLVLNGKVAYVMDGFGFGMSFIDLTDDAKNSLKQILDT